MIAGLPWTAWLLLVAGVGTGLGIAIRFYVAHRPRRGNGVAADRGRRPLDHTSVGHATPAEHGDP